MPSNLFPRFSIRMMLLLMVNVGLIATFMAGASRGSSISLGMATSMLVVSVPILFFAFVYWVGLAIATTVAPNHSEQIAIAPQDVSESGQAMAEVVPTGGSDE